jgi:Secretion system C-terminal sorting domain
MLKSLLLSIALLVVSFGLRANTYYVTTVSDTGAGSLRAMIDSANTRSGLDTISLSLGLHDVILLGTALPTITDSLVITGMPCQNPTIDGDSISFNHPAFFVSGNSKPLTLNYLNIFNCKTSGAGKAGAVSAPYLYMNYCCFYGNSNVSDSATAGTAGVAYSPNLWGSNCTFTSNSCTAPANNFNAGAGALVSANGNLFNCTFYNNYSASYGGALNGNFNLTNCTIAANYAGIGGGGLFSYSGAGGLVIANNIVWGNTIGNISGTYLAGIDLYANVQSGGCNILQDVVAADSFKVTGSDVSGTDPQLGAFGYYSGCVPVIPILCGSVAQNHASCTGATATDAEGIAAQGTRDAGAFEITHPHLGGDTIDSIQHGGTANLYNFFNTTGLTITWPAGITDSSAAMVDTGSYTVIGTNFLGCSDTATAIIRYLPDTLNIGIKALTAQISFTVYPNPAKDVAVITWKGSPGGELSIKVNDMLGRIVASQDVAVASGKYTLNTSAMVAGVYCITIQQGEQKAFSGRLIVINR